MIYDMLLVVVISIILVLGTWDWLKKQWRISYPKQEKAYIDRESLSEESWFSFFQGAAGLALGSIFPGPIPGNQSFIDNPPAKAGPNLATSRKASKRPQFIVVRITGGLIVFDLYAGIVGFKLAVITLIVCFFWWRLSLRDQKRKDAPKDGLPKSPNSRYKLGLILIVWLLCVFLVILCTTQLSHPGHSPIVNAVIFGGILMGGLGTIILPTLPLVMTVKRRRN